MDGLPPEIVSKILSKLDPASLTAARQVCRRWWLLSESLVHPLLIPKVARNILQHLYCSNGVRQIKILRRVTKLWKAGIDQLTLSTLDDGGPVLRGVTCISSHNPSELQLVGGNPFPTRIIRADLCYNHSNPENPPNLNRSNLNADEFAERFGEHIMYLQVSIEQGKCSEDHLSKILSHLRNLKGFAIKESPSNYKCSVSNFDEHCLKGDDEPSLYDLGVLKNIKFIKLEDYDAKLMYTKLYANIINTCSENLDHLEINGYRHLDMAIPNLLPSLANLTKLKMDAEDPHTEEILELLNKSNFKLTYFSLRVNGFGCYDTCKMHTALLHKVLGKLGPSLKRLELKLNWFGDWEQGEMPPLVCQFPSCDSVVKLERLKLVGYKGSIDFVKNMRSLKALMLVNREDLRGTIPTLNESNPELTEIYLANYPQTEGVEQMRKHYNFMYEGDPSFKVKYCGLKLEGFP